MATLPSPYSYGSFGTFPAQEWGCFYIRVQNWAGFVFGGYVVVNCCGSLGGSVKEKQEKDLGNSFAKAKPGTVEEKELDQKLSVRRFIAMSFVT